MSTLALAVSKASGDAAALRNRLQLSPADAERMDATGSSEGRHVMVKGCVWQYEPDEKIADGHVACSGLQRRAMQLGLNDRLELRAYEAPPGEPRCLGVVELEVDYLSRSKAQGRAEPFDANELVGRLLRSMTNCYLNLGQSLLLDGGGVTLKLTVLRAENISEDDLLAMIEGKTIEKRHAASRGVLMNGTDVQLRACKEASGLRLTGASAQTGGAGLKMDWDFTKMGIGGLDAEFNKIFRRAFIARLLPPAEIERMGYKHVRGMLLYGPPGTGKTLLARQIGKMLNGRKPKVVNGPEVLSKFVGESERHIRELFADAEAEQEARGADSDLHIIIMDELDALCRQRGSRNDGTGVGDTVVNQLLSKIDGVDSLNNILIIGMTNRLDMIDTALLRPGRMELQLEINLPDEKGRRQILDIHTLQGRTNGFYADDIDFDDLARRTKNYSGAELSGLVTSAMSWAMKRTVNVQESLKAKPKIEALKVTAEDFERALLETTPQFGVSKEDFDGLVPNGIIEHGERIRRVMSSARALIRQSAKSEKTRNVTFLLEGKRGVGRTALAAHLGMESGAPYVRLLSPEKLVGLGEAAKLREIDSLFQDAYKSQRSIIVMDDLERLIDYVPSMPARFSNALLQALLVLIKRAPPHGRRLAIIATTSSRAALEELQLTACFDATLTVPSLQTEAEFAAVLEGIGAFAGDDLATAASELASRGNEGLPIKKLIMMTEMAKQVDGNASALDKFRSIVDAV